MDCVVYSKISFSMHSRVRSIFTDDKHWGWGSTLLEDNTWFVYENHTPQFLDTPLRRLSIYVLSVLAFPRPQHNRSFSLSRFRTPTPNPQQSKILHSRIPQDSHNPLPHSMSPTWIE